MTTDEPDWCTIGVPDARPSAPPSGPQADVPVMFDPAGQPFGLYL